MKTVLVVEDDPEVQALIEAIFSMDPRFTIAGVRETAEDALEAVRASEPEIIVLDHNLKGELTGLEVARHLKDLAPEAKIIMFTAHQEIHAHTRNEPAVDAFLLKTEAPRLLPLAHEMTLMMGFA